MGVNFKAILRRESHRVALVAGCLLVGTAQVGSALQRLDFTAKGADDGTLSALKSASLLIAAQKDGTTGAQDLFAAARADYGRLVGALYARGYYSPVIHILLDGREAGGIAPLDAPAAINTIRVTVDPGPIFRFSRAEIAPLAAGTKLPPGFAAGEIARSGEIQDAVSAAITGWRDVGNAKAAVGDQQITANHPTASIDARVRIAPGPKLTFGKLTISGASTVREDRIREIAGFPTGQVFDPKLEEKAAARLRRTGAFRSVTLTEDKTPGPDGTLGATIAVVDEAPRKLGFGAEIASLDGLTLTGYWLHRNLFGGAEQVRVDGSISGIGAQTGGIDYSFGLSLLRPGTISPDSSFYVTGKAQRLNLTSDVQTILTLGTGLNRTFSDTLTGSAGIAYHYSQDSNAFGTATFHDIAFPITLNRDTRDKPLDARRGSYLSLTGMPFVGFDGTGTGAQIKADVRGYKSVGENFVLAGRIQLGSVLGASLAATPRDYLFYSGGGGTVRGQAFQSLGVYALAPGEQSGGRNFLGLSGEARVHLKGAFGMAVFYDAGYVSANRFFDGSGGWQAGAGIGARYDTPIGPIRFDIAVPVGGATTAGGLQFYLGIGQAF